MMLVRIYYLHFLLYGFHGSRAGRGLHPWLPKPASDVAGKLRIFMLSLWDYGTRDVKMPIESKAEKHAKLINTLQVNHARITTWLIMLGFPSRGCHCHPCTRAVHGPDPPDHLTQLKNKAKRTVPINPISRIQVQIGRVYQVIS